MKYFYLLALLLTTSLRAENTLTLYILPSPKGMDWSSPFSLASSAASNLMTGDKRFIGHVLVGLECPGRSELTGMTADKFDYVNQLLWQNRGFGVFWHSFPGRLETKDELTPELNEMVSTGRGSFVRFLLSEGQCARLGKYLTEYRENNVGRHYGLAHRPLHAEGAGCSAFAVSFVEAAGLLDTTMREGWQNFANIPPQLLGPPVREESVSFFKILLSGSSWAKENSPHTKIIFWDPDRMNRWVQEQLKAPLMGAKPHVLGKLQGLLIDKSSWPVPEHPIWRNTSTVKK